MLGCVFWLFCVDIVVFMDELRCQAVFPSLDSQKGGVNLSMLVNIEIIRHLQIFIWI